MVLSDTDVVQPDLLFVSRERAHLLTGGDNVRGAPDLVVEILSPATADRDRGYKRALYAKHGVRSTGWSTRQPNRRSCACAAAHWWWPTFGRNETLRSPLLAGFELALDDLFSS